MEFEWAVSASVFNDLLLSGLLEGSDRKGMDGKNLGGRGWSPQGERLLLFKGFRTEFLRQGVKVVGQCGL